MESLESDFSLPLPQNRDAPQSDFNFPNSSEVLGRVDEVLLQLERSRAPPGAWKAVAVEYYRLVIVRASSGGSRYFLVLSRKQLYEEFQVILERAVEAATSSLLDGSGSAGSNYADDGSYGPLSLQQINVCTTLAAFHIYKVRSFECYGTTIAGGVAAGTAAELEASLRAAEDLLKKAEVILNATVTADPGSCQTATSQAGNGAQFLAAGRGAQLAAAARLMLSTSAASPTSTLRSGGRNGAAPQKVTHTETQKRFLDGLSHDQRQTLSPLVCYGYLYLSQHSVTDQEPTKSQALTRAFNTFRVVLASQPDSVLGKLGLAAAYLAPRQYIAALRLYANVLYICPNGPPDLRLALGICHFHLGGYDRAQQAFLRVLQLRPCDADALCGLAAVTAASGIPGIFEKEGGGVVQLKNVLQKSLKYYEEAHSANPRHPLALLGFANSAFFAERYDVVDQILQQTSCLAGAGRSLIAEWWFQRGRLRHSKGDGHGALMDYATSLHCDPHRLPARFCIAQTSLLLGNYSEAERHLQILIRWCPKDAEAYKLLAYTSLLLGDAKLKASGIPISTGNGLASSTAQSETLSADGIAERETIASKCVDIALTFDPEDKEARMLKIRVEETSLHRGHLWLLEDLKINYLALLGPIEEILGDPNIVVELVNNLAVLYALSGDSLIGVELFSRCRQALDTQLENPIYQRDKEKIALESQRVVIRFNFALALEASGKHKEAMAEYKLLSVEHPSYVDVWIRCAWMAMSLHHNYAKAKKLLDTAVIYGGQNKDVLFLLGEVFKRQGRWEKALKVIKQAVGQSPPDDSYSRTALGSIYHQIAINQFKKSDYSSITPDPTLPSSSVALAQAGKYYREALRIDPTNWHAGNGIAVLLAQQGLTGPALEAFSSLLEACKAADPYGNNGNTVNTEVVSPLPTLTRQQKVPNRYTKMEGAVHKNLGLLYLSMAMTDHPSILPGKEIGKLDSVKVAKSLKHYLAALSLKPTSKSIHIQIGRLYHDSCRFREGQPFLENACAKWPKDPIFRHNLSILLEKAVMSEMRVDQYISDPSKVCGWIEECGRIAANHELNYKLKSSFKGISAAGLAMLRSQLRINSSLPALDEIKKVSVFSNAEDLEALYHEWSKDVSSAFPPEGLELLPSLERIQMMIDQVRNKLCAGLMALLPSVEAEWRKRNAEFETLKAKNEELRLLKEERQRKEEQELLEDVRRQKRLADQLQEEQEEIARSMPSRRTAEQDGRKVCRVSSRQADRDFLVEGEVCDGELEDDGLLADELTGLKKKENREREKKRKRCDEDMSEREKRKRHRRREGTNKHDHSGKEKSGDEDIEKRKKRKKKHKRKKEKHRHDHKHKRRDAMEKEGLKWRVTDPSERNEESDDGRIDGERQPSDDIGLPSSDNCNDKKIGNTIDKRSIGYFPSNPEKQVEMTSNIPIARQTYPSISQDASEIKELGSPFMSEKQRIDQERRSGDESMDTDSIDS